MPPAASAGKNFNIRQPSRSADSMSEGVIIPGMKNNCCSPAARTTSGFTPGLTPNCAPASMAAFTCDGSRIVPAPTSASGQAWRMARMQSRAHGVRSVISMRGSPPSTSARASDTASSTESATATGTTRLCRSCSRTGESDACIELKFGSVSRNDTFSSGVFRPQGQQDSCVPREAAHS